MPLSDWYASEFSSIEGGLEVGGGGGWSGRLRGSGEKVESLASHSEKDEGLKRKVLKLYNLITYLIMTSKYRYPKKFCLEQQSVLNL